MVVSLPSADVWDPKWGRLRAAAADFDPIGDKEFADMREADDGDEGRTPLLADDDDDLET